MCRSGRGTPKIARVEVVNKGMLNTKVSGSMIYNKRIMEKSTNLT